MELGRLRARNKFVLVMILVVLMAVLGVVFKVYRVEADGTIYIRADGSIDPPSAPILSVDNVTYTFTGNIKDSIVVERDDIVVDGAGYTLQGIGSETGIDLTGRNNVTVRNLEIKAFTHGIWMLNGLNNTVSWSKIASNMNGIYIERSSNNTISGNSITNNDFAIMHNSSNCNSISGNNITASVAGAIVFWDSSNNTISGNVMSRNKHNFGVWGSELSHFTHSIDASNLVNGKPVYYLVNQADLVINPETHLQVGYLALINCINITLEDLTLTNNVQGLLLAYINNSS